MSPSELDTKNNDIYRKARERVEDFRKNIREVFPDLDPMVGHPKGAFIRVSIDRDVAEDGTWEIDYSVKIDWFRVSVKDFLKIAAVLNKHFPEYSVN